MERDFTKAFEQDSRGLGMKLATVVERSGLQQKVADGLRWGSNTIDVFFAGGSPSKKKFAEFMDYPEIKDSQILGVEDLRDFWKEWRDNHSDQTNLVAESKSNENTALAATERRKQPVTLKDKKTVTYSVTAEGKEHEFDLSDAHTKMAIAGRIYELCEKREGLTVGAVCKFVGMNGAFLSSMKSQGVGKLTAQRLETIAGSIGVDVNELLFDADRLPELKGSGDGLQRDTDVPAAGNTSETTNAGVSDEVDWKKLLLLLMEVGALDETTAATYFKQLLVEETSLEVMVKQTVRAMICEAEQVDMDRLESNPSMKEFMSKIDALTFVRLSFI